MEQNAAHRFRYERDMRTRDNQEWSEGTKLIWHPDEMETHYETPVNSFCRFRKTFDCEFAAERAQIRIFADSRYKLFVNGQYVGRGPCRSDPRWQYYDTHDIAHLIVKGVNTIAVLALHFGYGTGQSVSRIPALLAEARVAGAGGKEEIVGTDSTWVCSKADEYLPGAPRINGCQGAIEIVDARLREETWTGASFDDNGWRRAKSRGKTLSPFWNLIPRPIPLLQEGSVEAAAIVGRGVVEERPHQLEKLHTQMIAEERTFRLVSAERESGREVITDAVEPGFAQVITFDFGKVEAGYLQVEAIGPAGAVLDAIYAEELWEGQALLNEDNNRSFDRFILSGEQDRLEVAFGWKACRYVQIRVRSKAPVVLHRVSMLTQHYPADSHSSFACDDPLLNGIWDIAEHTLRICMQDAFVDSPSREQQQWMGDGRWQAIMNYYYTGDGRLHRKLLEQIGQSQDWLGMTTSRYPDGHHNFPPIPSFCLQWICSFAEYQFHTGDTALLSAWWPNLVQALRWFSAYENDQGLLENVSYWPFIDWGEAQAGRSLDVDRGGVVTALNLQYLEAMKKTTAYAKQVNDAEAAEYFHHQCSRLADAIRGMLWNASVGAYSDCLVNGELSAAVSEPTNALALLHLHREEEERGRAIAERVFGETCSIDPIKGSPYFMPVICRALMKFGMTRRALELIRGRYGTMIQSGATTVWEAWVLFHTDSAGKIRFNSASHAWGSMPLVFFLEAVAGIEPLSEQFRTFRFKPNLGDLTFVRAAIPTPGGELAAEIRSEGDRYEVNLRIPNGCRGFVNDDILEHGDYKLILPK